MKKLAVGNKYFYQFDNLAGNGLLHFTSTKAGWGGDGKCRFTGDTTEVFDAHRQELAESWGLQPGQFVFPRQTHSNHVTIVQGQTRSIEIADTDALITDTHGLCICVQTADCVPVLIYDPVQRVVAAVHAGWRGTIGRIAAKTVLKMQEEFQCDPHNLVVGIGPSISGTNYEVSSNVIEAVQESFSDYPELLTPNGKEGKALLDLWKANQVLLTGSGVPAENIEIMGLCSFREKSDFFSARRDGVQTGRMVSGIMLK